MEKLVLQQQLKLQELERIKANHSKVSKEGKTNIYCDLILKKVKTLHENVERNHVSILKLLTGGPDELKAEYFEKQIYNCCEDIRIELEAELQNIIAEDKQKERDTTRTVTGESNGYHALNHEDLHLPRISVPKFHGKYDEWVTFRDLFKSLIHDRGSLSNVQKIHYLKCSIGGEAEALLRHLSVADANYTIAWKILCDRYDNKQMLLYSQFRKLFNMTSANETASSLKNLLDRTTETVKGIEQMNLDDLWESSIVYLTAQRLPPDTRELWEQNVSSNNEIPTFDRITSFIEQRFRALEAVGTDRSKLKPKLNVRQVNVSQQSYSCSLCKRRHSIRLCDQFKALDTVARVDVVKTKGLCMNCLGFAHRATNCPSQKRCLKCNKGHHTLLHKATDDANTPNSVGVHSATSLRNEVLLATAMVDITAPHGQFRVRALLDQGSQISLITEATVQLLGLRRKSSELHITGISNVKSSVVRGKVQVQLRTLDDDTITFNALILDKLTSAMPTGSVSKHLINETYSMRLADPEFYKPGRIDILLGADMYAQLLLDGVRQLSAGSIAQRTKIGWIISGGIDASFTKCVHSCTVRVSAEDNLNEQMRKFWELEEIPSERSVTEEEQVCESHYQATTRRLENGRFEVSLPFKANKASLGHSRHIAEASLIALERKFAKEPELKREYVQSMQEYISAGYMVEVQPQDRVSKGNYLPHHGVIKDSTSTKLRVVFDASRKTSSGVSLNDVLHTGPALQNDLNKILMRFRTFRYAYEADISKMFTQINMNHADSQYQRILWRPERSEPIKDYHLTTVTFGTTCAPYLAIRTLNQLAESGKLTHPLGSQQVYNNFYVDDLLSGGDELQEAIAKRKEVDELLESGGFKLRKWLANDLRVLKDVPAENIEMRETLNLDLDKGYKSLGLEWHPIKDYFTYHLHLRTRSRSTKRTMLSDIATLYDPLGWIAPVIIRAKIMLQALWLHGCNWDEPLPADIERRWLQLRSALDDVHKIQIPRWLPVKECISIDLHGFCDASNSAYAAVVYIVTRNHSENKAQIIAAKTKVAPIKTVTIPRLELCGAVLLARLVKYVKETHNYINVQTHLWSDSMVVLSWLKGHPSRWSIFVANRTIEIFNAVGNTPWRHVPSRQNPSDLATRGTNAGDLANNDLWWTGPPWLTKDPEEWPKGDETVNTELEIRKTKIHCLLTRNSDLETLLYKFSSLTKLIRVTAYCFRFGTTKAKAVHTNGYLNALELKRAMEFWIRFTQREHFSEEINALEKGRHISSKSSLKNLNPVLDNGVLRLKGRLANADLSDNEQRPILLPRNGHLTKLLLEQIHKATMHGHTQLMMNTVRKRYWILSARQTIKQMVHRCVQCFRAKAKVSTQLMGSLPQPRVNISRPFTHTGVDFCGPIELRDRRGRGSRRHKAYIAVFICLCVKAIHIELVNDYTAQSFLAALRRFMGRRGFCAHMYSDCGTNFVGANTELNKIIKSSINQASENLANEEISWHFIPPASPHFGGLWEAGVKSIKTHLKRTIGVTALTYEEMTTVLIKIEACLNSRPLCPLSDDPTDIKALTPAHFLIGDTMISPPETDLSDVNITYLDRWRLTQKLSQMFWARWKAEYLTRLQARPKWLQQQPQPKIGDICIVSDDKTPSYKWPLAKIIELHPGKDALVRVVSILLNSKILKRPVTKIALLPTQDNLIN